jgi:hypothetical protein
MTPESIEVAYQLFQRERDGGDRSVEGSGDAGGHADGCHAAAILRAEASSACQQAADAGTDLHRRAFKAE